MATEWEIIVPAASGILGTVLGTGIGAWLTNVGESRRWRRDYLMNRVQALQTHFGDVVEALDSQFVVSGQAVDHLKGMRKPVPDERVERLGVQWARVFSRKSVESPRNVQDAIVAFDQVRADVIEAINSRDYARADAAVDELGKARADVVHEINKVLLDARDTQVLFVLSTRERIVNRLLRRSPVPPPEEPEPDDPN